METKYIGKENWQDGSRQELIPQPGESKADAARYMREHLELFDIDLDFDESKIESHNGKFYITLFSKG
jgi:hypothetical protein